jgi:hypothetical protein
MHPQRELEPDVLMVRKRKYFTCYFERKLQGYKYKAIKWSFQRKFLAILVKRAACIEMED